MNSRERPSSGKIEKKKQAYCLAAAEDRLADPDREPRAPIKAASDQSRQSDENIYYLQSDGGCPLAGSSKKRLSVVPIWLQKCQMSANEWRQKKIGDLEKVNRLFSVRDQNIFHSCCQVARRLLQPIRGHLLKVRHLHMNKAVSSSQSHHPSGRGTPPCLNVTSSPWQCTDASRIGEQKRCLGRSPL